MSVTVVDGVIVSVERRVPDHDQEHVRLSDGLLTAGMLDLQVNGFAGADFGDADDSGWTSARAALLATGVTSFVPTLVTGPLAATTARVDACAGLVEDGLEDGSRVLGFHLEGPFLSTLHRGAHEAAWLREPTADAVAPLLADGRDRVVRVVTLAPELPGALEAVRTLVSAGVVVSVGHSDADAATVHAAAESGATLVTHLFNAQRGLHHREAGVPGAALTDPRLRLGLIVDLHHVSADVVRLVFAAAGARVVLVTDAVAAAGMPPGTYTLGGGTLEVTGQGEPPRRADGTLAGSALTLDAAVRTVVGLGVDRATALLAATRVPADVLGRTDLGRLEPGAPADLVWWDDRLHVRSVWLAGRRTG